MTIGDYTFSIWFIVEVAGACYAIWWARKTTQQIKEVHNLTNSRMSELLEAVRKSSTLEGREQEREQDRDKRDKRGAA